MLSKASGEWLWRLFFCLMGAGLSWIIADQYSEPREFNRGVAEERLRCSEDVKATIREDEVDQRAEKKCVERFQHQQLDYQAERERLRADIQQSQLLRRYFANVFDQVNEVAGHAKELASGNSPSRQAVAQLNEEARGVLRSMARGRQAFAKFSSALDGKAEDDLRVLEAQDVTASEILELMNSLAWSRKDRDILIEDGINTLGTSEAAAPSRQ